MKRKHMEAKTGETPSVDGNNNDDDDEEEEEEEKINAFFTLVRNTRDVHKQMLIGSQVTKDQKQKAAKEKSTWTPSFQWEDFAHQDHPHLTNIITLPCSSNSNDEQKRKTNEHQDLDLNLSL
ncbi:protein NIM1-INTERACTING 1-like [Hibiscus syriacus]|uniref:protein NIM1-INTERACTING 1-like n=1 Tax=Hibiscus syriacus TaxID=106335 RepID=UPI001923BD60|nr:protein NIM1-INTERACTING 1-like [Hibiscus syriacus]